MIPLRHVRSASVGSQSWFLGYWAAVSEHSALEATEAKLRYFKVFPDDEREAEQLVELLKKLGISPIVEKPVVIDLPTESRPRHFELLLP